MIRVVLVGLGSIGRRHLANIRLTEPDAEITVVRHRRDDSTVPEGADRVVHTLDEALAYRPDVGFLCGPTSTHAQVGIVLASAGLHLFVEKPLALNAVEARQLVDACNEADRMLIVGYNLRFCESLRIMHRAACDGSVGRVMSGRAEVGQYLPEWRSGVDYRTTNSARSEFGGSIVFELSHEIDYMRWLLGEVAAVDAIVGRLSNLDVDVDDTAELLLSFTNGCFGSIHMDMTRRDATRRCELIGTDGTLTWNAITGETCRFRFDSGWTTLVSGGGESRNDMYLAEAAHVFACIRGEATPLVDGTDGARVVELAQAALSAAHEQHQVGV
jgi:predicted dehydrogenase